MLRTGFLLTALVSMASAAPIDCTPGTLSDYLSLSSEGCRIGPADFSEFVNPGVLPGNDEISPATINVTPLFDLLQPGLLFTYGAAATGPTVLQSVIEFRVTSPDPPHFTFGTLGIGGNSATPGAAALVTSELCFAAFIASICAGSSEVLGAFDIGVDSTTTDRRDFASQPSIAVRHDLILDGGFDGVASVDTAELRIGQVPEPAMTVSVFAAILVVIASTRRRRQR